MKRFKAAAVQIAPDLTNGTGSFDAGSTDSHHVFPAAVMGMDGWSWSSLERGHHPRPHTNDKPEPLAPTGSRSLRRAASHNLRVRSPLAMDHWTVRRHD